MIAAQELARAGWPVFPTRNKLPLTPRGFKDATTESGTIAAWWTTYPEAQVSIAIPNGRLVVDIDTPDATHPNDGFATLRALEAKHGPLPPTLTSVSGRGGEHRWYTLPIGAPPLVQRDLGPGIQTRVAGKGYVVAPPSIHHETGKPYAWRAAPMAEAPAWLIELLRERTTNGATTPTAWPTPTSDALMSARGWLAAAKPSVQGQNGSASLMRAAGVLVRGFALGPEIAAHLLAEYNARAVPPWDDYALSRAIESAATSTREPLVGSMLVDKTLLEALRPAPQVTGVAGFDVQDIDSIFAPLPPITYLVNGIGITPGAPALIAGYGYSGKTAAIQQLAVDLARPREGFWNANVWGKFPLSKRARVLHVDYEQGGRLTKRRYQRLAQAANLTKEELRGHLAAVNMPTLYLNTAAGIAELDRLCGAFDLVIIDSFIAACPGLEENSSNARESLDQLTRVSEHHGCAFVVIHHARKPSADKPGGAKMSIRGSGAIFDACASVLVFDGEKDAPKLVSHEKERNSGITVDNFNLVIEDVEGGGLRVRADEIITKSVEEKSREQLAADTITVRDWLVKNPAGFQNHEQLRAELGIHKTRVSAAVGALQSTAEIVIIGRGKNHVYQLSDGAK